LNKPGDCNVPDSRYLASDEEDVNTSNIFARIVVTCTLRSIVIEA
jgi:hypothetical protein